jgi:RND family efflux transporter MFP subunit
MFARNALVTAAPLAFGVALAAVTLAGCSRDTSVEAAKAPVEAAPIAVQAVRAATGDIVETLSISGSLVPQTRVAVTPKLQGRLERVLVDIGARVSAGQTVATLDAREIVAQVDAARAAVNVARASVDSAEAALSNAVLELDRSRNLFERGALPRQRLDAADTAHRGAVAQRDLARANLAQAEAALRRAAEVRRDAVLVSPIAGVVVERNYDAGNLVGPGDKPVVAVADVRVLELEAGVSELEAGRLRVGMPARIDVQARPGQAFEGQLAAIAPEIDARNRHFQVEVRVPNERAELLSGMYATARIETSRAASAVTVPRDSVTTRDGKRIVLRVAAGTVQPTTVTEGIVDEGRVQIVAGLASGDVVVADARRRLPPGAKVKAVTQ